MARRLLLICVAALGLAAPAPALASTEDEILVLRDGGLTPGERRDAGVSIERALPLADVELVSTDGARADALAALRADPDVRWAEPNRPRHVSADPLAGLLWGLQNTGQPVWWRDGTPDADIDAPEAWTTTKGAGVTVAVVDTGADLGHPDLAGRLAPGHDFVDDDADPTDLNGHGTHVAGTIAAGANGIGVVGVAPEALVMPLRVLDASGSGSSADVAAAFAYAGERGVRVVNASLGSAQPSLAERRAIREHPETLYVVAAGNGGDDGAGDDNDGAAPEYPCALDEPNLVCVGSSDRDDAPSAFSNYGAESVDLFAPGEDVVSTYPRGRATALDRYFGTGDGYEIMRGTSMATPHAAGVAALAAAVRPSAGAAGIKAALLDGADRLPGLAGLAVTGGRLNAAAAVGAAAGTPDGPVAAPAAIGPQPPAPRAPDGASSAVEPLISAVRIAGRPRICGRRGCVARTATLSFVLAAEAQVTVHVERRRCSPRRCRWRPADSRTLRVPAGRTRWMLGRKLLGIPLARAKWRVTLTTAAGSVRRTFRVR